MNGNFDTPTMFQKKEIKNNHIEEKRAKGLVFIVKEILRNEWQRKRVAQKSRSTTNWNIRLLNDS